MTKLVIFLLVASVAISAQALTVKEIRARIQTLYNQVIAESDKINKFFTDVTNKVEGDIPLMIQNGTTLLTNQQVLHARQLLDIETTAMTKGIEISTCLTTHKTILKELNDLSTAEFASCVATFHAKMSATSLLVLDDLTAVRYDVNSLEGTLLYGCPKNDTTCADRIYAELVIQESTAPVKVKRIEKEAKDVTSASGWRLAMCGQEEVNILKKTGDDVVGQIKLCAGKLLG